MRLELKPLKNTAFILQQAWYLFLLDGTLKYMFFFVPGVRIEFSNNRDKNDTTRSL